MIPWIYLGATVFYAGFLHLVVNRLTHRSYLSIAALTLISSAYFVLAHPARADDTPLSAVLEKIRAKYNVPALGAALFTTDGLRQMAVTGFRKRGDITPVTENDVWHLGSDTKVMTATLAGTFVAEGKIKWDDKIATYFPDLAAKMPAANRDITLRQILSHGAGLEENDQWDTYAGKGNLMQQRRLALEHALTSPQGPPGTFHYSNVDYVVIAALLEKISGQPWENLMRNRIFIPLGMTSAGFGGLGTPGQVDQPWPHDDKGAPLPTNGPAMDNPPVMGPAGACHMTIGDWAKFLTDQLRGVTGEKALLTQSIYEAIQSPSTTIDKNTAYGFGWGVLQRSWGNGKVLQHAGSNTMNYCVVWLGPNRKFGVLATCNQGGESANKACDAAVTALIDRSSSKPGH